MSIITKLLWAIAAGIVLIWIGGGTPASATETTVPIRGLCHIDGEVLAIPEGYFQFYPPGDNRAIGTHSISGQPCGYIDTTYPPSPSETTVTLPETTVVATTTTVPGESPDLPPTGARLSVMIAAAGSAALMAGYGISRVARR